MITDRDYDRLHEHNVQLLNSIARLREHNARLLEACRAWLDDYESVMNDGTLDPEDIRKDVHNMAEKTRTAIAAAEEGGT